TPEYLLAPQKPSRVTLPKALLTDTRFKFFQDYPPQHWLPEIFLERVGGSLMPFFETLHILSKARSPFNNRIRGFCDQLWTFYMVDDDGRRRRELLEKEGVALLEKKIYHVVNEGGSYRQANDDCATPPAYINDEADVFTDQDQSRSPGNPTVKQTSPINVFDATYEEEVFTDSRAPIILGYVTKSLGPSMSEKDLGSLPGRSFKERCHYSTFRRDAKERKNHGRDLFVDTEEQALMADGVALFGDHYIFLAEASLIYEPKLDKQVKDKFKLARCMRDSWNLQIRSIAREAMPPTGLSVFGSTSFGDETTFYAVDFMCTYV
ncbi:hypothetical protein BGZ95_001543, partial [Linnemannia exigua]